MLIVFAKSNTTEPIYCSCTSIDAETKPTHVFAYHNMTITVTVIVTVTVTVCFPGAAAAAYVSQGLRH
jgi:hypothetical protein